MVTNEAPNMKPEQELQQSLIYLEQLKDQIALLNEQLEILELAIKEHNQAIETLKDFSNLKKDHEMLIPIGADSMVFGKILDPSKVIINIGAGVAMEENIDKAIKLLSERIEKIDSNKNKIATTLNGLQEQMLQLNSAIEERYRDMQSK
jgi:prefoldin alpha subunit